MNQTNTERPVYSDSETNDSNESVLLSESNTYSAASVFWLRNKWFEWVSSFKWIKHIQCRQCILTPKQMIRMFVLFSDSKKHTAQPVTSDSPMNDSKSQFFVVNQTHTAYPAYLKEASSF